MSGGHLITLADLKAGLEPFRKIRQAVGERIEVMCELHRMWSSTAAIRICQALEDYDVFRAEDPIGKMDDAARLADLRRQTRTPICRSETLGGVGNFRNLLAADAIDFVTLDMAWRGGLTEGRKITAIAEAYAKPLAQRQSQLACQRTRLVADGLPKRQTYSGRTQTAPEAADLTAASMKAMPLMPSSRSGNWTSAGTVSPASMARIARAASA